MVFEERQAGGTAGIHHAIGLHINAVAVDRWNDCGPLAPLRPRHRADVVKKRIEIRRNVL